LVLANRGFCMIDELDKMTKEDRSAMHEALEQQTVTISKANIQATLRAETTVLAAANPKFGRFDAYELVGKQIDLPPTLINRFDLIFPIKDLPDKDNDEKMAGFILDLHQNTSAKDTEIETDLLRKYIAYARRNIRPKLSDGAIEEIKQYYITMRGSGTTEESAVKTIPITARQLEALVRLAEANAKLRLSDKVTRRDAKKAIELLDYCLMQVGLDKETGKIDIDRITTGITAAQRSTISVIREVIVELENKIGKTIPVDDIVKEAEEKGVKADKVDEAIEKLKRSGDLFEPRRGFIQRT
jgi:replicative DNA helicase Mcm